MLCKIVWMPQNLWWLVALIKIMESSVAHKVASGIDALLEKSEELVDHYLPITYEELGHYAWSTALSY